MEIKRERAIQFLQELIQINSVNPPGNELEVAEKIAEHAEAAGLETEIKMVEENRANILIRYKGKNPDRPALVFSGHMDTVHIGDEPWEFDPFAAEIVDGKMYGRGSCDMKSGVAGTVEAMILLKESGYVPEGDILFAGTMGEEIGKIGAEAFVDSGDLKGAGAMVVAEPTDGEVITAHKGTLWFEFKTYGKTAHGSMANEGVNAILHMNEIMNRLINYRFNDPEHHYLLNVPSMNIGKIEGGIGTNVVPDYCKLFVDIRTTPGALNDQVLDDVSQILKELENEIENFHAEITVFNNSLPLYTDKDDPFVKLALEINHEQNGTPLQEKAANYGTDASVFGPGLDIPIVIYGPGKPEMAHQPNEYVEIDKYLSSIEYYVEMAKRYFN